MAGIIAPTAPTAKVRARAPSPQPLPEAEGLTPTQPEGAPKEALMLEVGMCRREQTQCYTLVATPEAMEEAVSSHNDDLQRALEVLPGRYWLLGKSYNGQQVFRQEPALSDDAKNSCGLFLFWQKNGWYVSEDLVSEDSDALGRYPLAYIYEDPVLATLGMCAPSKKVHVPFNKKKPTPGVSLMAYEEWVEIQLYAKAEELEAKVAELEAKSAELEDLKSAASDSADAMLAKGWVEEHAWHAEDQPHPEASSSEGKGRGKGSYGQKRKSGHGASHGRGGWMVRSYALLRSAEERNWRFFEKKKDMYMKRGDMRECFAAYESFDPRL